MPAKRSRCRRALPWLGLACILGAYVAVVARLHPTNFFGYTTDDTIYFSSARAIAHGAGYVLPSLPGTPRPWVPVLYPWVLSWIWRWNPLFPANLADAVILSVSFALAFLTLVFVFLRRLGGLSDAEALLITFFCALHPLVVFYGANVVTEIPFAALTLGAMVAADGATRSDSSAKYALLCGLLAGLSAQMRIIGMAVIAGIAVAALLRRAWRQLVIFSASAGVFLAPLMWHLLSWVRTMPRLAAGDATNFGWNRTWTYYTSYLGFWRASLPDLHVIATVLKDNAVVVPGTPSFYFLLPSLMLGGVAGLVMILAVTGLIFGGIVRQARRYGWRPIHFVVPFYAGIAFIWSFSDPYRYFIPFLPLFVAGYWLETKRIAELVRATMVKRRPATEMILAGSLAVLIVAGNAALAWNYFGARRKIVSPISGDRAGILAAKREAYDWISKSTARDSRIVAYEDAGLYLYTGRQAVRTIPLTTAEFFEPEHMKMALDHWTDAAVAVRAGYWLVSDDDFRLESRATAEAETRHMQDLERFWPVVFCSQDGRVRIYSLTCWQHPEDRACKTANGRDQGGL
jgi:4-amino-4-deoxy-L-arabinose transferase-like glycosyltransferase